MGGSMRFAPWSRFFRLPNLPTAPGDALVGSAFMLLQTGDDRIPQMFAAAASALFLYMFGLADNDVAGAPSDGVERPIPAGEISIGAARSVRLVLLLAAVAIARCFALGVGWGVSAALLVLAVAVYNRVKWKWLMGLCRGLSLVAGALAVGVPSSFDSATAGLAFLAVGWTCYVTAVTKLSEGEESASDGLGRIRYAWGLGAFIPCGACFFLPAPAMAALPAVGALFAYLAWCAAVSPLALPHGPDSRRRAVGQAVGALLYLQIGFMLVDARRELVVAALAVWVSSRLCRRLAPNVSGS